MLLHAEHELAPNEHVFTRVLLAMGIDMGMPWTTQPIRVLFIRQMLRALPMHGQGA